MPKFFAPREQITKTHLYLTEDAKHISKVLRMSGGDKILVCDGRGFDYDAEIEDIEQGKIICRILNKRKSDTEPELRVTLFQGLPKASKMDYIIQKTTELGISKIVPCKMSRCVVKLENKAAEQKKTSRWQKIAGEAAKQSGRGIIPEVTDPVGLNEAAEMLKSYDIAFAPYECEENYHIKDALLSKPEPKTAAFIIGPEGGFELSEIEALRAAGVKTVTLGKRILRTETAGEAVLAMIMYEIGDVNQ